MQQKYKQKKEKPKVENKSVDFDIKETNRKPKRGKRAIQKEKVLGKSVDEWLAFAVSSSVTDYTRELSKNVDAIIREVEN